MFDCSISTIDVSLCSVCIQKNELLYQSTDPILISSFERSRQGTTIRTLKRYSQFEELYQNLTRAYPAEKKHLPRLPPKNSLGEDNVSETDILFPARLANSSQFFSAKYRPTFLESRRRMLSYWLEHVLLHPELGGSELVRRFVTDK